MSESDKEIIAKIIKDLNFQLLDFKKNLRVLRILKVKCTLLLSSITVSSFLIFFYIISLNWISISIVLIFTISFFLLHKVEERETLLAKNCHDIIRLKNQIKSLKFKIKKYKQEIKYLKFQDELKVEDKVMLRHSYRIDFKNIKS